MPAIAMSEQRNRKMQIEIVLRAIIVLGIVDVVDVRVKEKEPRSGLSEAL